MSRPRTLWQVLFGGTRNPSMRLYPASKARRIAARFNRLYGTTTAYASSFGKVRL